MVDTPADLADRDIVMVNVSSSDVFLDVLLGADGLLAGGAGAPALIVDASTISREASERARAAAAEVGCEPLAAPVSGNAKVVKAAAQRGSRATRPRSREPP